MFVIWFHTNQQGLGGWVMSLVLFCITFAIPHMMQIMQAEPERSSSHYAVNTPERHTPHAGREYGWIFLQTVFPIVCMCIFAFALTDGRIRRFMRLGSLDDNDHVPPLGPRSTTTSPNNVDDISSTIRHVPLMEYHTREELRCMRLHDLKELAQLACLRKYGSQSSSHQKDLLQDKEDVIRDILGTDDGENDVCSICQEEYLSKQLIRVLPRCGHRYHVECVDQWFLTSNQTNRRQASCPLCNTKIQ